MKSLKHLEIENLDLIIGGGNGHPTDFFGSSGGGCSEMHDNGDSTDDDGSQVTGNGHPTDFFGSAGGGGSE